MTEGNPEDIPEGICIVCGHKLSTHILERMGWRCHSIAQDGLQCECWLRIDRTGFDPKYYDLKERYNKGPLKEFIEALK